MNFKKLSSVFKERPACTKMKRLFKLLLPFFMCENHMVKALGYIQKAAKLYFDSLYFEKGIDDLIDLLTKHELAGIYHAFDDLANFISVPHECQVGVCQSFWKRSLNFMQRKGYGACCSGFWRGTRIEGDDSVHN